MRRNIPVLLMVLVLVGVVFTADAPWAAGAVQSEPPNCAIQGNSKRLANYDDFDIGIITVNRCYFAFDYNAAGWPEPDPGYEWYVLNMTYYATNGSYVVEPSDNTFLANCNGFLEKADTIYYVDSSGASAMFPRTLELVAGESVNFWFSFMISEEAHIGHVYYYFNHRDVGVWQLLDLTVDDGVMNVEAAGARVGFASAGVGATAAELGQGVPPPPAGATASDRLSTRQSAGGGEQVNAAALNAGRLRGCRRD